MSNIVIPNTRLTIGTSEDGSECVMDLVGMPHLLVAGATGMGKSIFLRSILKELILNNEEDSIRLFLIDPKRVELALFRGIPHVEDFTHDLRKANLFMLNVLSEIERRLKWMDQYNIVSVDECADVFSRVIIVIDEFGDLVLRNKRYMDNVIRISQLGRAAGTHLILSTQRPIVRIVSGLIKNNITHRVAFGVPSKIDSRVILDRPGAEELSLPGDMLYYNGGRVYRLRGRYTDKESILSLPRREEVGFLERLRGIF